MKKHRIKSFELSDLMNVGMFFIFGLSTKSSKHRARVVIETIQSKRYHTTDISDKEKQTFLLFSFFFVYSKEKDLKINGRDEQTS